MEWIGKELGWNVILRWGGVEVEVDWRRSGLRWSWSELEWVGVGVDGVGVELEWTDGRHYVEVIEMDWSWNEVVIIVLVFAVGVL